MNQLPQLGKMLVIAGIGIIFLGALFMLAGKVKGIGHLPGDIYIQRRNFTFYFPLATSILLSLVLSLFWWIFSKK
ncbi:MAG: DUF2905 domain-containing protein [Candidatus Omnitrophica bacterium]|nr:DUF2905 domain-containing protein [Candidatus Omnitrophota bacterium]